MRIFIFILFLILLAVATYAGHWAVSASSIVLLVFFILIWSLSEKLILKSFNNLTNLQETHFHPIEKKIQLLLQEQGLHNVTAWATADNSDFQLYAFGSTKSCHLIFTKSMLTELTPHEILNLSSFTSELLKKKVLSRQLLWSSIIIATNKPLKAVDRLISFFSGLRTDNGEPKHIIRRLNTWILLTFRRLNRNSVSDSKSKKNAKDTLTNYSYINFNHTLKPLKPLSIVDYALK